MKGLALLAAAALALEVAGCVSESADLGAAPPVALETPRVALDAPASRDGAARLRVRDAMASLGDGDVQSVRVRIRARSPRDAEGLRRLLLGVGADPARIAVDRGRWPRNQLLLSRSVAETTPCASAIAPVAPDDPLPSLISLARCTQDNNLADMLVDPGDLVRSSHLAAEDGAYLVDGVESWRRDRAARLPSQDGAAAGTDVGSSAGTTTPFNAPAAAAPVATPAPVGPTAAAAAAQ